MLEYIDFANQGTLPLVSSCNGTKMPPLRHQVPADSNVPVLVNQHAYTPSNELCNYNKLLRSSAPSFALKYAGAISNTVLHPLCPSLYRRYAALA